MATPHGLEQETTAENDPHYTDLVRLFPYQHHGV
jgi:hypothetical protein